MSKNKNTHCLTVMPNKGFTLIELLIVIAIIAIIAAVVFVALDPLTRFRDARDAHRWSDIAAVLDGIKVDQVDNGGAYMTAMDNACGAEAGEVFMVTDGVVATGCADSDANCDVNVAEGDNCVNLATLVTEGYIGAVPISPDGAGTWTASSTGYTLQCDTTGIVTVRACESEGTDAIWIAR